MISNSNHLQIPHGGHHDNAPGGHLGVGVGYQGGHGGNTNQKPQIKLKYKTDLDKATLIQNFEKRGWQKAQGDEDWNVLWALPWRVKQIFNPETGHRLGEMQILNHFPNHYELTRKDLMVKNIKRFRKDMEKENNPIADKDDSGALLYMDIVPMTYILPADYTIFVEEFKKYPNATWIMKPTAQAQGKGIFLVNKLKQLQKWANTSKLPFQAQMMKEAYVISRYIDQPLLVGSKKFDLRIYVLVTSYRPLKVWLSSKGFARFCNEKYSSEMADLDNMMVHLTNVAIQKGADDYNQEHGSKWSIDNLRFYLEQTRGKPATDKCFDEIKNIIYISLKSVQSVMINDKHCFELYGYDVLIEDNLKPWLIEVNASPSLSTTTEADRVLKMNIIKDAFNIVIPSDWAEESSKHGANTCKEYQVGSFSLIIDESQTDLIEKAKKIASKKTGANNTLWR